MKTTATFTIDIEVLESINLLKINKSDLVNESLKAYLRMPKVSKVKEELQQKLDDIEKNEMINATEKNKLIHELELISLKEQQEKEEQIKKEQELSEEDKLCAQCGDFVEGQKTQTVYIEGRERKLHSSCFMNNYEKYKLLTKKPESN